MSAFFCPFSPAGCPVALQYGCNIDASVRCTIVFAAVQLEAKRMPPACLGEVFLNLTGLAVPQREEADSLFYRSVADGPHSATG
jgi:hypothetical protein